MKKIDIESEFGSAIKTARNLLGISQKLLAQRCHLSPAHLSGVERGARGLSLKNIIRLAEALDVSMPGQPRPAGTALDGM
jgi:transcriptional regulator with XRE-family HTH domain